MIGHEKIGTMEGEMNGVIVEDGDLKSPPKVLHNILPDVEQLKYKAKVSIPEEEKVYNKLTSQKARHIITKDSDTYGVENFNKNALLIINNKYIRDYHPRLGTEIDEAILLKTFSKFDFEVTIGRDLTRDEIMEKLYDFTNQDFTDYGCVAVAILSHGADRGLIYARDKPYHEKDVFRHFMGGNTPSLVTKPKIFMFQACRGYGDSIGVNVMKSRGKVIHTVDVDEKVPYNLPVETDMLILHSSYMGKPSYRDIYKGSWFIQSLCRNIDKFAAKLDVESILINVKREVAINLYHEEYNRATLEVQFNKQMPVITSTLIRKLYLKKYEDIEKFDQISKRSFDGEKAKYQGMKEVISQPIHLNNGNCSCYQEHFQYMRECLRFYLQDHPDDTIAKSFYRITQSFDGPAFNEPKKNMLKVIAKYLKDNNYENFKYIHTYNTEICPSPSFVGKM
ncbi:unnamed protein product [Diatraea saccharalis]|uniref:Uncharacterized protein n=1 Tax=Diatraea saccharalis TaxID=40085 RepID=A0A9N9WJ18_9NEOP|nr:unnamed protein product [Diatraea saccharalis]